MKSEDLPPQNEDLKVDYYVCSNSNLKRIFSHLYFSSFCFYFRTPCPEKFNNFRFEISGSLRIYRSLTSDHQILPSLRDSLGWLANKINRMNISARPELKHVSLSILGQYVGQLWPEPQPRKTAGGFYQFLGFLQCKARVKGCCATYVHNRSPLRSPSSVLSRK